MSQVYQAKYKGETLASAPLSELVQMEGNYYFPPSAVELGKFEKSETTTYCPWKGTADHYSFKSVKDIAWMYPETMEKAMTIKGFFAFYVGKHDGLVVEEAKE